MRNRWRVFLIGSLVALLCGGCGWIVERPKKEAEKKPAEKKKVEPEKKAEKPAVPPKPEQKTSAKELEEKLKQIAEEKRKTEQELKALKKQLEKEKASHEETKRDMLALAKRVAEFERKLSEAKAQPKPASVAPKVELKPDVKSAAEKLLAVGRRFYEKDDYENARAILEALVALGYRDGFVYFMLGRCCAETGDVDLGIENYRKACQFYEALEEKPRYYLYALNNLGALLRQKQKYAEAAAAYEKARRTDEKYATVYYNLGVLYQEFLNDKRKAIECFEKYIELKGDRIADAEERVHDLRQELKQEKE